VISKLEISPDALILVLNEWRNQIVGTVKSGDISNIKNLLNRFISRIDIGYKKANIWYTYPMSDSVPFSMYSVGGTLL